jgi:hypothetical protein
MAIEYKIQCTVQVQYETQGLHFAAFTVATVPKMKKLQPKPKKGRLEGKI